MKNNNIDEIIHAMAESLGLNKSAALPISMEKFKEDLAKAEKEKDCNKISELKELSQRVIMNPDLAFNLAVAAQKRCMQSKK